MRNIKQYWAGSYRNAILLILIIIVGGISKITLFFMIQADDPSRIFSSDSASYVETAKAFLETGRFAVSPDSPEVPQVMRTPGYPFFITAMFFLFGESYSALIIVQIMISLGTIIVTYLIAANLWKTHIAVISGVLLSLDTSSFVNSQKVLTETLFTFILSITVCIGIYALRIPKNQAFWVFLYGVLLALATLIRPISYYAIIPVTIVFIVNWKICFHWQWGKILITLIVLFVPWIGLIGGWQLRNYFMLGSAELSTIQGVNLLFYRGAGIIAQRDGVSFEEARQRLGYGNYREVYPETRNWSNAQLSQHWKREGWRLIYQYPGLCLKSQIWGAIKMMLGPGEQTFLTYVSNHREDTGPGKDFFKLPLNMYIQKWIIGKTGLFIFFLLAESYLIVFYSSIMFSLWHLLHLRKESSPACKEKKNEWKIHMFTWMLILYFIVISAGPEAYSRFRIPIMPLLSLYASHGLYQIITRLTHAKQ